MDDNKNIAVEESRRQDRIVTKEIDENDPDYIKNHDKDEHVKDIHINDRINDYIDRDLRGYELLLSTGIEFYYLYLFLVAFSIPVSFVVLKAFIVSGEELWFELKLMFYIGYIAFYSLFVLIVPLFVLKRKDVSLYHKKIARILMGNNLVLLMWNSVFVITPIAMDIVISVKSAQRTFLLYFFLAIFDIGSQLFILFLKEKKPHREVILERISLVLSIVTIWGYGAIICPLIFSKIIERVIFDLSILAFVGLMSFINLIAYKKRKNKVEKDYKYIDRDIFKGKLMKAGLITAGVFVSGACLYLICFVF